MRAISWLAAALLAACALPAPSKAGSSFFFSTGNPDGKMATASRLGVGGNIEIESADDFALTSTTQITSATFTGLVPLTASLSDILDLRIEIYRVFPKDSDTVRTPNVPTRTNSPSDVEFDDRSASAKSLTFTPGIIQSSFTAANSVLNGIFPKPNFNTKGEGPVTGKEVEFNVLLSKPFLLPADHYFFVPQVQLTNGDFFWLSAPKPIVSPGTPFPPGFTDLQEWIRNENLAPDWLRVGTDIVGGNPAPQFNAAFTLSGESVPEPSSVVLISFGGLGLAGVALLRRKRVVR